MELFGFQIKRTEAKKDEPKLTSFAPPVKDDGAAVVTPTAGAYGTFVDLEGSAKSEAQLVTMYREMAQHHEVDSAVDDVINEAICNDDVEKIVEVNLEDTTLSENIKKVVADEFNECVKLLGFNREAYEIFRRWYVDGRINYHVIIDEKNPQDGIKEMRYIDPRKLRKIREVKKVKASANQPNAVVYQNGQEFYIYNDKGFLQEKPQTYTTNNTEGLKIANDAIVQVTSGLMDKSNKVVLGYLQHAVKPLNQLTTLEDATLIYKLARAPERRIFYIDIGDLPKGKAEQYLKDIMAKFKNKLVYDSATGEIRDDRKFMTLLEDYWLPRRGPGKGTEVTTLQSQVSLTNQDELSYYKNNLFRSLYIPVSRTNAEATFSLGRAAEIGRDEIKFHKFVVRLRLRFSQLFIRMLEKQLILKQVMTPEEWKEIESVIKFRYAEDNFYAELKDIELLKERLTVLELAAPYVGRYWSNEWVRKNLLKQSEEDIEQEDEAITLEKLNPQYDGPLGANAQAAAAGGMPGQPGAGPTEITSGDIPPEDLEILKEFTEIFGKDSKLTLDGQSFAIVVEDERTRTS